MLRRSLLAGGLCRSLTLLRPSSANNKKNAGPPTTKKRPEKPAGAFSIFGDSDRTNDNHLKRNAPDPLPGFRSPFERVRRQQRQTPSSSSAPGGRSAALTTTTSSSSAAHMYANKEYAWENYTDDPYYGARRLKEYYQRFAKDRGVRYYFLGIIVVMAVAVSKLYRLEAEQRATEGLLGPKKKAYRSRLTIVLDVDETIVSFGDKAFRMKAGMVARPYLAELLDYLSEIDAEVVLWSACTERYMRQVLQVIDPDGVRISQYITKDAEWFSQDNYYEKNVLWLKRHLDDILMIENRPLSIRNCNGNSILVDDFIRGEYMDTGRDHPPNDQALKTIREIIEEIEQSGMPVPAYLSDVKHRHKGIKEIPCHRAIRQLPEELARGVFYFVGDKFRWNGKEMQ